MTDQDPNASAAADPNVKTDPAKGDNQQGTAPAPAGKAEGDKQDTLPEKFKGKSAEDIAKSYIELERKIGEQASELGTTKTLFAQHKALTDFIASDPELTEIVKKKLDKAAGKQVPDEKKPDDTRVAMEDMIINKFEEDRGLNTLSAEKKLELHKKIGMELAEMLDPGGTKNPSEIIRTIPTDRLPRYLDKAYKLATIGDEAERARSQAFIDARMNSMASIGSISSSGARHSEVELTPGQREAARRMGISEEDYKKQVEAIKKENS